MKNIYKFQKQICEGKYIVFWNIQDYFKHENFKIHWLFYKHVLNLSLHYINKKYLNNLENIMNILNHMCFLHLMNVLCGLRLFFYVSLIELNAWKDEWLLNIGDLQEGKKKKQEEWPKKEKGLKRWLICGRFTNTCKLDANSNGKKIENFSHFVI